MKIKGYNNLEKDENSGAVILAPEFTKRDLQIDMLIRKVNILTEQNKKILEILEQLTSIIHK